MFALFPPSILRYHMRILMGGKLRVIENVIVNRRLPITDEFSSETESVRVKQT
jgi:hypothetical protein